MTTTTTIPALRQSLYESMGCPRGYSLVQIKGMKADSSPAMRGREIHEVLAKYAEHCAKHRCEADFAYLDSLLYNMSEESAEILTTCRDNLSIDWKNFFGAEISMGLDANFKPTWSYDHDGKRLEMSPVWALPANENEPEYCGIADALYIYPGGRVALIDDAKSHPRAFPADTWQGKLYSLMVFMHLPEVQEVTFRLRFVRYANISTSHTFYRSDVPPLKEEVMRVRARQVELHAKDENDLPAIPGSICARCPGSHTPRLCPISEMNPMLQMSPEDRLKFRLWIDAANRANNQAMRDWVDGTEDPIMTRDANGKYFRFGPVAKEKTTYPVFKLPEGVSLREMFDLFLTDPAFAVSSYMPIVDAIVQWAYSNPEDLIAKRGALPWQLRLRIGSTELASPLKAKFREVVHNAIKDHANVETKTELRVERAAEVDDGTGEEHREYGDGEAA